MGLSGQQCKKIQEALLDAFPTESSLKQMLSYELDWNLNEIAGSGNLKEIIFEIIKKAESEERIEDLIHAALRQNPGNSKLQALNQTVGSQLFSRNSVQQKLLKIVLSAQEISIQTWQQFKSPEERLSYLFEQ